MPLAIQNLYPRVINLLLLIYILMNTLKDYLTIYLQFSLGRSARSCNTLNDLSNNVCVSNKQKI